MNAIVEPACFGEALQATLFQQAGLRQMHFK